jgi:hypothetical protein
MNYPAASSGVLKELVLAVSIHEYIGPSYHVTPQAAGNTTHRDSKPTPRAAPVMRTHRIKLPSTQNLGDYTRPASVIGAWHKAISESL